MHIVSLLYIDESAARPVNLAKNSAAPLDIYLGCAVTLARSAAVVGYAFSLVTNRMGVVQKRLAALGLPCVNIVEQEFKTTVPLGTRFYHAHFKIDVIREMGTGRYGESPALVDLDAILNGNLPRTADESLLVYNITGQMELDVIKRDLALLIGSEVRNPRWFGGEFIAGPPESLAVLSEAIESIVPKYLQYLDQLDHIGDEAVVSAALNVIAERGVPLRDLGQEGIVVRWWSIPSRHRQPAFGAVSSAALLHLPADKIFLASLAVSGDISDVTIEYLRHRMVLKIRNLLTVLRDRLVGKEAFLPRFTDQVRRQ